MNHWIENIGHRERREKREPPTDIFMNIGGPFLLTKMVPRAQGVTLSPRTATQGGFDGRGKPTASHIFR